jgi:hypothetical protein
VSPPLCIYLSEGVSWSGTVYLALYPPLCICHCIYICHCISAIVSAVLLWAIEYKERDWIIYRTKVIVYQTI